MSFYDEMYRQAVKKTVRRLQVESQDWSNNDWVHYDQPHILGMISAEFRKLQQQKTVRELQEQLRVRGGVYGR